MTLRYTVGAVVLVVMSGVMTWAQTPPDAPPAPLVIGRDPTELGEVIGKQFQIRAWVSEIGGAGMQKIYVVRLGADGNVIIPGFPPQHAEGMTIGALETALLAPIKPINPKANVWISITDHTPPATQSAATQASATTQPAAATNPTVVASATTQPAAATNPTVVASATTKPAATSPAVVASATTKLATTNPTVIASATTKPATKP